MNWKPRMALAGVVPVIALALAPTAAVAGGGDNLIRGNLTASMPTDAPINGVNPGGLPWVIDRGDVRVRETGRMDVRIEGLEIPRNGTFDNPVANIHAVLYCSGVAAAYSGAQPMTTGVGLGFGDARFRVLLTVPETCDDAVVLIQPNNPSTGAPAPAYIASLVAMGDD
jgi:hypothetical protein